MYLKSQVKSRQKSQVKSRQKSRYSRISGFLTGFHLGFQVHVSHGLSGTFVTRKYRDFWRDCECWAPSWVGTVVMLSSDDSSTVVVGQHRITLQYTATWLQHGCCCLATTVELSSLDNHAAIHCNMAATWLLHSTVELSSLNNHAAIHCNMAATWLLHLTVELSSLDISDDSSTVECITPQYTATWLQLRVFNTTV